jgi:hypothetical protein
MGAAIGIDKFLDNIEKYARDTRYDYSYYLTTYELERMHVAENIGELRPGHMAPIMLFLRDWMLAGWIRWTEKNWTQMDSELSGALSELRKEFGTLHDTDLVHLQPEHIDAVKTIFGRTCELSLASGEKAIATVASKILHLLNSQVFVMWDTAIIDFYGGKPDGEGYIEFLAQMKDFAEQLQPHLDKINKKADELRTKAKAIYGKEICSSKTLAKLIDECNWIETRSHS